MRAGQSIELTAFTANGLGDLDLSEQGIWTSENTTIGDTLSNGTFIANAPGWVKIDFFKTPIISLGGIPLSFIGREIVSINWLSTQDDYAYNLTQMVTPACSIWINVEA